ncbi:MAG: hypothetical protein LBS53_15465 [Synergistaceae bacterium]|nr:hypothetical protein [Synergistaceae bacterium]
MTAHYALIPNALSIIEEEKHIKKRLWKLAAGICLVLAMQLILVSCSSPAEWEGGGYGHASIGDYGETTGKNTAETNGMRFTLKGDDLKAVVLDEDYSPFVNDTEFDGRNLSGRDYTWRRRYNDASYYQQAFIEIR